MASVAGQGDFELAQRLALSRLELDETNPRFGGALTGDVTQRRVLNHIVETFGVDDVLSSLAVNGFFRAEPLIGKAKKNSSQVVIIEGNRRLAACLILVGDDRAADQASRTASYDELWDAHGRPAVDPAWVLEFGAGKDEKSLLTYLGVRHIAGSQPWDSYAKAAWVASVVDENTFTIRDVAQSVGDQYNTVERLLEGYYFVQQAEAKAGFNPTDSVRSGRGSVTAYPFSWVYTILGYTSVRKFLGLDEKSPKPALIPEDKLPAAKLLVDAMFGNRSTGRNASVSDSRELGDLASALARPETVAMLAKGMSVSEVKRRSKPVEQQLQEGLADVRERQGEIVNLLTATPPGEREAELHLPGATANRRMASDIERRIRHIVFPEPLDDDA